MVTAIPVVNLVVIVNGMNLINSLVTDKINELDLQITLICDRFFLESNFLMEPHLKIIHTGLIQELVSDLQHQVLTL